MLFTTFGNPTHKTLMLVHGLGVSYQVFTPLIANLQEHYHIIAVQVDGFLLDAESKAIPSVFTSIDNQVDQLVEHIRSAYDGHLDAAYGLSMGGWLGLCRARRRKSLRSRLNSQRSKSYSTYSCSIIQVAIMWQMSPRMTKTWNTECM